ncbi:MAG: M15 family metallopeptidase [Actinomycetota bacterium]|nr:M15 family metallopeptidase [Actinomycetota bacterium]
MRIVAVVCVWFAAAIAFLTLPACAGSESGTESGTEIPENEYGLEVVDNKDLYLQTVEEDPSKELVDLEEEISGIRLDVRYATEDNFMGEQLYPVPKAVLRKPAAESLSDAQEDLKERGLELEVFDGYRPYSVTERIWEPYQDPDFVADPAQGSRHNRGCAVDVTLIDSASGEELFMPTEYDDFTEQAAHDYTDLPEEAKDNRDLLREVMEGHGFAALETEWWHYDCQDWERFEVMDLPLENVP